MGRHVNHSQRNEIIKRCYQLFQIDGCEALTTRQIADECGISRALLYMYYHKKGDICVEIFNRMQNSLHAFLNDRVLLRVPERGYGAYYFPTLMGTLEKKNLLSVFLMIQQDSELLHQITLSMYEADNPEISPDNLSKYGIGVFIMMGAFSQLIQCQQKKILNEPLSYLVYSVLEVYYRYMGVKEKEIKSILANSRQFITDNLIDEFITYHETEYGYNNESTPMCNGDSSSV